MTADVPKIIRKRSDLVADQIKEAIISKKLPPGERLSDEKDFLKTYRVSKGTMREALKSGGSRTCKHQNWSWGRSLCFESQC